MHCSPFQTISKLADHVRAQLLLGYFKMAIDLFDDVLGERENRLDFVVCFRRYL